MRVEDDEVTEVKSLWYLGLHMDMGARYLYALRKLGLDPDCLFWAEDEMIGHPVLVLVTEQFDRVGPLELSKILFKAHDNAGTPEGINPFILRLHSPRQAIIREMEAAGMGKFIHEPLSVLAAPVLHTGQMPTREDAAPAEVFISAGGMRFKREWVYKWVVPPKKLSPVAMSKQWRRFTENVDRLAA